MTVSFVVLAVADLVLSLTLMHVSSLLARARRRERVWRQHSQRLELELDYLSAAAQIRNLWFASAQQNPVEARWS